MKKLLLALSICSLSLLAGCKETPLSHLPGWEDPSISRASKEGAQSADSEKPKTFTVSYNSNGGSGSMTDAASPYQAGTDVIVKNCLFTAPGTKVFGNWNTKPEGTGSDYYPGDKIRGIDKSVTLYAQWITKEEANKRSLINYCKTYGCVRNISEDTDSQETTELWYLSNGKFEILDEYVLRPSSPLLTTRLSYEFYFGDYGNGSGSYSAESNVASSANFYCDYEVSSADGVRTYTFSKPLPSSDAELLRAQWKTAMLIIDAKVKELLGFRLIS